jgi:predicted NBD/HSP70 family sugar kinase
VHEALATVGLSEDALFGVGVSVPGVVGPDESTVYYAANIDQFDPFDFRSPLHTTLRAPVAMDNNVNCAALGERWQGIAQTLDTFAVIAIGAGIGCGIVHDGVLLRGAHGAAGEVAFLPPEGELRKLNAEAHDAAGGLALLHQAQSRTGWAGPPPRTVEELFKRAATGEQPALTLVEEECQRVAVVIASVCAVTDPQAVILTGGVGGNEGLIERAGELATKMTIFPPTVMPSGLQDRASLVGAIHLATQQAHQRLVDSAADM